MELECTKLRLLKGPRMARVEAIVAELVQIRESAADPNYGYGQGKHASRGKSHTMHPSATNSAKSPPRPRPHPPVEGPGKK